MRKPGFKFLVTSLFLIVALLGAGQAARAASAPMGLMTAIDVCGCCPVTCGGGTFVGCYNVLGMPPNAVTCVYSNSGGGPGCVSCLLTAKDDPGTVTLSSIFAGAPASVSTGK
ncbi:MAG TPA: hypothetical protein VGG20_18085 [Thermoanaerobaculia bacterium]|jgi:hypothetical protein